MTRFLIASVMAAPVSSIDIVRREALGKLESQNVKVARQNDFCGNDYQLGPDCTVDDALARPSNTICQAATDCATPAGAPHVHQAISQESECRDAARKAGRHVFDLPDTTFAIPQHSDEAMTSPWGCYARPCKIPNADGTGEVDDYCYYLNTPLAKPEIENITHGIPICQRPKFTNGTAAANDATGRCPSGYELINGDAQHCRDVAACMGYQPVVDGFIVGADNASEHNDHPLGCFINHFDNRVYYNTYETGFEAPWAPSSPHPDDLPLCQVVPTPDPWAAKVAALR